MNSNTVCLYIYACMFVCVNYLLEIYCLQIPQSKKKRQRQFLLNTTPWWSLSSSVLVQHNHWILSRIRI